MSGAIPVRPPWRGQEQLHLYLLYIRQVSHLSDLKADRRQL
jgi:hypothetical protein